MSHIGAYCMSHIGAYCIHIVRRCMYVVGAYCTVHMLFSHTVRRGVRT